MFESHCIQESPLVSFVIMDDTFRHLVREPKHNDAKPPPLAYKELFLAIAYSTSKKRT